MQMAMKLGNIEVIKRFVEIGLAVAIVPRVAEADDVQQGRLAALTVAELPARELGLVERKDRRRSPPAVAFLHLLRTHLSQGKGAR